MPHKDIDIYFVFYIFFIRKIQTNHQIYTYGKICCIHSRVRNSRYCAVYRDFDKQYGQRNKKTSWLLVDSIFRFSIILCGIFAAFPFYWWLCISHAGISNKMASVYYPRDICGYMDNRENYQKKERKTVITTRLSLEFQEELFWLSSVLFLVLTFYILYI